MEPMDWETTTTYYPFIPPEPPDQTKGAKMKKKKEEKMIPMNGPAMRAALIATFLTGLACGIVFVAEGYRLTGVDSWWSLVGCLAMLVAGLALIKESRGRRRAD